jgi:hypothetical protein
MPPEHEPLECNLALDVLAISGLLFDGALDVTAHFLPFVKRRDRPERDAAIVCLMSARIWFAGE